MVQFHANFPQLGTSKLEPVLQSAKSVSNRPDQKYIEVSNSSSQAPLLENNIQCTPTQWAEGHCVQRIVSVG